MSHASGHGVSGVPLVFVGFAFGFSLGTCGCPMPAIKSISYLELNCMNLVSNDQHVDLVSSFADFRLLHWMY